MLGFAIGLITFSAAVLAFRLGSAIGGGELPQGAIRNAIVGLAGVTLAVASLQIAIGFYARTQQQAGLFMTPLIFLSFVPLLFFQSTSGAAVGPALYAIPSLGAMLLIRYGLAGTAAAAAPLVVVVSSTLFAALMLVIADRIFHSERAILRGST